MKTMNMYGENPNIIIWMNILQH